MRALGYGVRLTRPPLRCRIRASHARGRRGPPLRPAGPLARAGEARRLRFESWRRAALDISPRLAGQLARVYEARCLGSTPSGEAKPHGHSPRARPREGSAPCLRLGGITQLGPPKLDAQVRLLAGTPCRFRRTARPRPDGPGSGTRSRSSLGSIPSAGATAASHGGIRVSYAFELEFDSPRCDQRFNRRWGIVQWQDGGV